MKVVKHIVFQLIFLATLFSSLGLEASTDCNPPLCNVEFPANQHSEDNNVLTQDDSSEDDHINLDVHPFPFNRQLIFHPISIPSHSPKEHSASSWKPPKFS
jgi:hypothetical protein